MRTREEVRTVLALAAEGLGAPAIARATGVLRTTVLRRLAEWQWRLTQAHPAPLVRGLIESDGSRHENRVRRRGRWYSYSRYTFSNRSRDIQRIFCEHLDLMGIAWRRAGPVNISIARRDAVAALDAFVGPKR